MAAGQLLGVRMLVRWPDRAGLGYVGVQVAAVWGLFGGIPADAGRADYAAYGAFALAAVPVALIAGLMVHHSLRARVPWHGFTVWWFVLFGVWHAYGVFALLTGRDSAALFWITFIFSDTGNHIAAVAYQIAMTTGAVVLLMGDRKRARTVTAKSQ
ncbi:hypothetical protein [Actinokineospora globicatena]|nr:hypothetical protein [Actinokineospora globicatena]